MVDFSKLGKNKANAPQAANAKNMAPPKRRSIFDGIKDAKEREDKNYLIPGAFRLRLLEVLTYEAFDRKMWFIVKCLVLETSDELLRPVASEMSWMIDMYKYPENMSTIKQFVAKVLGCDQTDVTEDECDFLTGPDNPAAGTEMHVIASQKEGKKHVRTAWTLEAYSPAIQALMERGGTQADESPPADDDIPF